MISSDWCAGCGKDLLPVHSPPGARIGCCQPAYWSLTAPAARDAWYPTPQQDGWYLYGWLLPNANVRYRP